MALDMASETQQHEEEVAEQPEDQKPEVLTDKERLEQEVKRFQEMQEGALKGELLSLAESIKNTFKLEHDKTKLEAFVAHIGNVASGILERKAGRLRIPKALAESKIGKKLQLSDRDVTVGDLTSLIIGMGIAGAGSAGVKWALIHTTGVGGIVASAVAGAVVGGTRSAIRENQSFTKEALSAQSWREQIAQMKEPASQLRAIELLLKDKEFKKHLKANASEAMDFMAEYERIAGSVEKAELEAILKWKGSEQATRKTKEYLGKVSEEKRQRIFTAFGRGAVRGAAWGTFGYGIFRTAEWLAGHIPISGASASELIHSWHSGLHGEGHINVDAHGHLTGESVVKIDDLGLKNGDIAGADAHDVARQIAHAMADSKHTALIDQAHKDAFEKSLAQAIGKNHASELTDGRFATGSTVTINSNELNQALTDSGAIFNKSVIEHLPVASSTGTTPNQPGTPKAETPSTPNQAPTSPNSDQGVGLPPGQSQPVTLPQPNNGVGLPPGVSQPITLPGVPSATTDPGWFTQHERTLEYAGAGALGLVGLSIGAIRLKNYRLNKEKRETEETQNKERLGKMLVESYEETDKIQILGDLVFLSNNASPETPDETDAVKNKGIEMVTRLKDAMGAVAPNEQLKAGLKKRHGIEDQSWSIDPDQTKYYPKGHFEVKFVGDTGAWFTLQASEPAFSANLEDFYGEVQQAKEEKEKNDARADKLLNEPYLGNDPKQIISDLDFLAYDYEPEEGEKVEQRNEKFKEIVGALKRSLPMEVNLTQKFKDSLRKQKSNDATWEIDANNVIDDEDGDLVINFVGNEGGRFALYPDTDDFWDYVELPAVEWEENEDDNEEAGNTTAEFEPVTDTTEAPAEPETPEYKPADNNADTIRQDLIALPEGSRQHIIDYLARKLVDGQTIKILSGGIHQQTLTAITDENNAMISWGNQAPKEEILGMAATPNTRWEFSNPEVEAEPEAIDEAPNTEAVEPPEELPSVEYSESDPVQILQDLWSLDASRLDGKMELADFEAKAIPMIAQLSNVLGKIKIPATTLDQLDFLDDEQKAADSWQIDPSVVGYVQHQGRLVVGVRIFGEKGGHLFLGASINTFKKYLGIPENTQAPEEATSEGEKATDEKIEVEYSIEEKTAQEALADFVSAKEAFEKSDQSQNTRERATYFAIGDAILNKLKAGFHIAFEPKDKSLGEVGKATHATEVLTFDDMLFQLDNYQEANASEILEKAENIRFEAVPAEGEAGTGEEQVTGETEKAVEYEIGDASAEQVLTDLKKADRSGNENLTRTIARAINKSARAGWVIKFDYSNPEQDDHAKNGIIRGVLVWGNGDLRLNVSDNGVAYRNTSINAFIQETQNWRFEQPRSDESATGETEEEQASGEEPAAEATAEAGADLPEAAPLEPCPTSEVLNEIFSAEDTESVAKALERTALANHAVKFPRSEHFDNLCQAQGLDPNGDFKLRAGKRHKVVLYQDGVKGSIGITKEGLLARLPAMFPPVEGETTTERPAGEIVEEPTTAEPEASVEVSNPDTLREELTESLGNEEKYKAVISRIKAVIASGKEIFVTDYSSSPARTAKIITHQSFTNEPDSFLIEDMTDEPGKRYWVETPSLAKKAGQEWSFTPPVAESPAKATEKPATQATPEQATAEEAEYSASEKTPTELINDLRTAHEAGNTKLLASIIPEISRRSIEKKAINFTFSGEYKTGQTGSIQAVRVVEDQLRFYIYDDPNLQGISNSRSVNEEWFYANTSDWRTAEVKSAGEKPKTGTEATEGRPSGNVRSVEVIDGSPLDLQTENIAQGETLNAETIRYADINVASGGTLNVEAISKSKITLEPGATLTVEAIKDCDVVIKDGAVVNVPQGGAAVNNEFKKIGTGQLNIRGISKGNKFPTEAAEGKGLMDDIELPEKTENLPTNPAEAIYMLSQLENNNSGVTRGREVLATLKDNQTRFTITDKGIEDIFSDLEPERTAFETFLPVRITSVHLRDSKLYLHLLQENPGGKDHQGMLTSAELSSGLIPVDNELFELKQPNK